MVKSEDLRCLALNIYHEARNESTAGKIAVAQVVLNRVRSPIFPGSVCDVVYQGVHKGGLPDLHRCQFSWYCDGRGDEPRDLLAFNDANELAQWILVAGKWVPDITDGSLWYHAEYVSPEWGRYKKKMLTIDTHIFYK